MLAGALGRDRLILQNDAAIPRTPMSSLFNVGTVSAGLPSAPHLYGSFLDDSDFRLLEEDGAVGDIATSFFDAAGDGAPVP